MKKSDEKGSKLSKQDRISLATAYLVFLVDNFGFAVVYPLFGALLLDSRYGLVGQNVGTATRFLLLSLLFSAFPLAQFFGAPFFGNCADKWGRKKALFYTLAGVTLGFFLTALSLVFKSLLGLVFSRLFSGFFAGNMSISLAILADLSKSEEERTKRFGNNAIFSGISWIIAILVGGDLSNPVLLKFFDPSIPFWITGGLTLLALIWVALLFKETAAHAYGTKISLTKGIEDLILAFSLRSLRGLFLIYLSWSIAWFLVVAWLATISLSKFQLTQSQIVWVLIGDGIAWALANASVGAFWIKHFKVITLTLVGYLFAGISLLLSMTGSVEAFIIFYILATAFAGISWTCSLSLISMQAESTIQGLSMGLAQSILSLGMIFGPLIAGWLSAASITYTYLFSGTLLLIGFCLLLIWKKRHVVS